MNISVDIFYPEEFSFDKCLCQEDGIMANQWILLATPLGL